VNGCDTLEYPIILESAGAGCESDRYSIQQCACCRWLLSAPAASAWSGDCLTPQRLPFQGATSLATVDQDLGPRVRRQPQGEGSMINVRNTRHPSRRKAHWRGPIFLWGLLSMGCCPGACCVYPATACKAPPPPQTVPPSPLAQCTEVTTAHADDWPRKAKDAQYAEENAVYWVRAAYVALPEETQRAYQKEFAEALENVNTADDMFLNTVDGIVAAGKGDWGNAV
jgi:hypothetical protein